MPFSTIDELAHPPLPPDLNAPPATVHSCPSCSHWLPEGTLACPDCKTLAYGRFLQEVAAAAQHAEGEGNAIRGRELWQKALAWLPADAQQAASIREHLATIDARAKADDDRKARWKKKLGPLAPFALFLLKIKTWFFVLLKLKFFFSIFAFFGLYWALFGWQFALGITVSIFLHEMGHYVAVKRRGLKADLPFFMPGLGAYVRWYSQGVSREDLAAISLAGPLFGLGTALASYGLYWQTHATIFLVIANVGAWINILNLAPVFGLDGAQATYALSRLQRILIVATCIIFFGLTASGTDLTSPNNHFIFLIVAAGMAWRCFTRDLPEEPHTGTLTYFLALFLALGMLLHLTPAPAM
jgi:Zn-dependent protease